MGDFISNPSTTLPGPKVAEVVIPPGRNPNARIRASDYNAIRSALLDCRDAIRSVGVLPALVEGAALRWGVDSLGAEFFARPDSPPFDLLYQSPEVIIGDPGAPNPDPNAYLFSKVIDLAKWGLHANQDLVQPDLVVTVAGPAGGRVVPGRTDSGFPGEPPIPTECGTTGVEIGVTVLMESGRNNGGELYWTPGMSASGQYVPGVSGLEVGDPAPPNKSRYLWLWARRTADEVSPEDRASMAARAIGFHFNLTAPDNRVASWTWDIPTARNVAIVDRVIDMRAFGATGDMTRTRILVEILRGEEVVRSQVSTIGYAGEVFDPPTYPVRIQARAWTDTPGDDYLWNENNSTGGISNLSRYGDDHPSYENGGNLDREAWLLDEIGYCVGPMHSKFLLRIWRPDDDGATEYLATRGAEVPTPCGDAEKAGGRVRVTILRCGTQQSQLYPFDRIQEPYPTIWEARATAAAIRAELATAQAAATAAAIRAVNGNWFSGPQTSDGSPTTFETVGHDGSSQFVRWECRPLRIPAGAAFDPLWSLNVDEYGRPLGPHTVTLPAGAVFTIHVYWIP